MLLRFICFFVSIVFFVILFIFSDFYFLDVGGMNGILFVYNFYIVSFNEYKLFVLICGLLGLCNNEGFDYGIDIFEWFILLYLYLLVLKLYR